MIVQKISSADSKNSSRRFYAPAPKSIAVDAGEYIQLPFLVWKTTYSLAWHRAVRSTGLAGIVAISGSSFPPKGGTTNKKSPPLRHKFLLAAANFFPSV